MHLLMPLFAKAKFMAVVSIWLDHMYSMKTSSVLIQFSFEFWPCWMIPLPLNLCPYGAHCALYTDNTFYICLTFTHLYFENMILLHPITIQWFVMLVNPMCEWDPFFCRCYTINQKYMIAQLGKPPTSLCENLSNLPCSTPSNSGLLRAKPYQIPPLHQQAR